MIQDPGGCEMMIHRLCPDYKPRTEVRACERQQRCPGLPPTPLQEHLAAVSGRQQEKLPQRMVFNLFHLRTFPFST